MHEKVRLSREELYDRVWSEPIVRFAHTLGISDVAVAKACKRLDVPTPPRGYWAQLAARKKVRRTTLPRAKAGTPGSVTFDRREPSSGGNPGSPSAKTEEPIRVATTLDEPHPLVAESARALMKLKPDRTGLVRGSEARCLSIDISKAALDRGLRLMDALLKRLEEQGVIAEVLPPEERYVWKPSFTLERRLLSITQACVDGVWIPFCLEEDVASREVTKPPVTSSPAERYRWEPSGRLALRIRRDIRDFEISIGHRGCWADGAKQRLENILHHVVTGLRDAADATKLKRQRKEQARLKAEARQREVEARQAAEREEAELRKTVEDVVPRWRFARDLRAYVADVRAIVAEAGLRVTTGGEAEAWLNWCDAYAEEIDPLTHFRQEVARVRAENAARAKPEGEPDA